LISIKVGPTDLCDAASAIHAPLTNASADPTAGGKVGRPVVDDIVGYIMSSKATR
jgi:hypothetical protein